MAEVFLTPRVKRLRVRESRSLEIPPSPNLKNLGFGTGVKVMLYERSPRCGEVRSPWAIKKLSKAHCKGDIADRLEREAKILQDLDHPNIIGFRGYKRNLDGTRVLAVENGEHALYDVIEEIRENQMNDSNDEDKENEGLKPLPAKNILKVIKSIASALDYLHTEKHLLHGDLKAANILVVGNFEAVKLCDFGVALPINDKGIVDDPSVQYIGTEPWTAIEVVEDGTISTKTDIFALGCTIFEMLALDTPHSDKLPAEENDPDESYDDSDYQEAVGHRPELPADIELNDDYEIVLNIFYACTMDNPKRRPTAKRILEIIGKSEK